MKKKMCLLTASTLTLLSLNAALASETKKTFLEFWKAGSSCRALENWKPVTKLADFELPETKQTPLVWRSRLQSDPFIFIAEPASSKVDTVSNAWMLWEGRKNWLKLPIEKGTTLKDLKAIQICIYTEGHYFDMTIPDTDYHGVNPSECEKSLLYKFSDPEIRFVAKRCNP